MLFTQPAGQGLIPVNPVYPVVLVTAGQMPLPPTTNGVYYFQFTGSAIAHPWASWSFW